MISTLIATLILVGAGQGTSSVGAPKAAALTLSGPNSAIHTARQVVARDQDQFIKLWREHTGRPTAKYAPNVDFRGYDVVAVFAGPRNTGGYSISIDTVKTSG